MRTNPSSNEHVPERTCVGCRQRRAQPLLVRCVLGADGAAHVSRTAAGRGAWLCVPSQECFTLAVRRRGFERAWRRVVPATALDRLARELGVTGGIDDGAGPARRTDETKG